MPFVEEPVDGALDPSEMAAPSALGVVSGLSLCSVARTTASITVTQSLSLSPYVLKQGVSVPALFFFSLAVLLAFPYERGTIYLFL